MHKQVNITKILEVTSPHGVYELLAAGVPVLQLIMLYTNPPIYPQLGWLLKILPGFTKAEIAALGELKQLELCALTRIPLSVPVKYDSVVANLKSISQALTQSYQFSFGYNNDLLVDHLDDIFLDLDYLLKTKRFLAREHKVLLDKYNKAPSTAEQLELDDLRELVYESDVAPSTETLLMYIAAENKHLKKMMHRNIKYHALIFILGTIMCSLYLIYNNQTAATKTYRDENNAITSIIKSLLSNPFKLIFMIVEGNNSLKLILSLSCELKPSLIKSMPQWFIRENFEYCVMRASLLRLRSIRRMAQINPNIKFDFAAAQEALPKVIAHRFADKFKQGKTPGLFFWKQAFPADIKEEAEKNHTAYQPPIYRVVPSM